MKTVMNRNDVRMYLLILVVLKSWSFGAQLPGIPPLFPLQEPSTFAFDLQPLQSACAGGLRMKRMREIFDWNGALIVPGMVWAGRAFGEEKSAGTM